MVFLLDLERKRYRLESSEEMVNAHDSDDPKKWEWRKSIHTSAYDGEMLQHLTHRKANGLEKDGEEDLSISKGSLGPGAQFGPEVWPIFFAHGIVPTVQSSLLVDKLPLSLDADDFNIAGWQRLRGQNCLLMRTDPLPGTSPISDEFWVNPKQQSAIQRHVYFSGSNPWTLLDISWKNTAYGWWDDQWSETWYEDGHHARRVTRFRVDAFEANLEVSDSDFKLPAEPGMIVKVSEGPPPGKGLDPFLAASKTYRVSPSGSWDEIAAKGFTTLDGKELPPERGKRWLAWSLAAGLAIVFLLAYVLRGCWKRATS